MKHNARFMIYEVMKFSTYLMFTSNNLIQAVITCDDSPFTLMFKVVLQAFSAWICCTLFSGALNWFFFALTSMPLKKNNS